jgi:CBS domain containing-hemolysin-like protein
LTYVALGLSAAFLVINFITRAAGASLVRTPRADALHDAAEGDHRAQIVADLLEVRATVQPALNPVLTGLVLLTVIPATWAVSRMFSGWQLAVVLVIMVGFLVLISDIAPRTLGRGRPRSLAYRFAALLRVAIAVGSAANDFVSDVDEDEPEPVEDDVADAAEKELITQVLDFTDTIVREVMTPRPDMITVTEDSSTDEALDVILEEGRSRIPVTGEGIDDIVGVLYARDLLVLYDEASPAKRCRELARPPYFVPESKQVAELLREMQKKQVHMAIVVDEFGGTAGLVTIEDLLEELVGEIADEYDTEEPMAVELEDGGLLVDARMDVDAFAGLVGAELPDDEYDTVGGLVLGLAGRVPREGESFEYDGLTLTATQVQGRRVARVRVRRR